MITISRDGDSALVRHEGLDSETFVRYRRALAAGGARFDAGRRASVLPLVRLPAALAALRSERIDADLAPEVRAHVEGEAVAGRGRAAEALARLNRFAMDLESKGLRLAEYQRLGVVWLSSRQRAMLTDEPGLGKTAQALLAMGDRFRTVVVCPASLKDNWAAEVVKWRPDARYTVLSGRGSFRWPEEGEVVILNYDILPGEMVQHGRGQRVSAKSIPPPPGGATVHLIADEAHACKGRSARAKRMKALVGVVTAAGGTAWGVTGTELMNREEELWSLLRVFGLEQDAFGDWTQFVRLMRGRMTRFGYEWGTPDPQIAERLRLVSLKRLKSEVLSQLPPKRYQLVPVEIDSDTRSICDELVAHMRANGIDVERLESALQLARVRVTLSTWSRAMTALAAAKTSAALEVVSQYEEAGEPLIVFSAHRAPVDLIASRPGWAAITGDTPVHERQVVRDRFQRGELKGIAGTIDAMGFGLTLTRSANVLRIDRDEVPANNVQAEDRAHRIGQVRGVLVIDLVAEHPLDERLTSILTRKDALIEATSRASARTTEETALEVSALLGASHGECR